MKHQAVMFDLDGTLADTLADITSAGNHVLARLGHPPIDQERYRYLAGQGARSLLCTALGPEKEHLVPEGLAMFRAYYEVHGLDHVRPYRGIPDLMQELTKRGIRMAILSNKPEAAVHQVVQHLFDDDLFEIARGHLETPGAPGLKPDPAGALAIADQFGIEPAAWIYVGDTRVDMETAHAARMFAVGVLWGFRDELELRESGAEAIIREPSELLRLL